MEDKETFSAALIQALPSIFAVYEKIVKIETSVVFCSCFC